jgi:hypothetical protein
MRTALGLLLLGSLLTTSGCGSFRAQVGVGGGLGVEIAVPFLLHAGVGIGGFDYHGLDYDRGVVNGRKDGDWSHSASLVLVHSLSHNSHLLPGTATWRAGEEHFCGGLAPIAWDLARENDTRHSWGFELAVHLIGVGFRIGWNPWYLFDH